MAHDKFPPAPVEQPSPAFCHLNLLLQLDTSRLAKLLKTKDEKILQTESEKSWLKHLKTIPDAHLGLARHYSLTGEKEKCLRALEKARAAKSFTLPFVAVDPLWETLRAEPDFQDILRRMNL